MRNRVIVRTIRTLRELESRRHTWTTLAAALGCTSRQARRYVYALQEAHEPVCYGLVPDQRKHGGAQRSIWIERDR